MQRASSSIVSFGGLHGVSLIIDEPTCSQTDHEGYLKMLRIARLMKMGATISIHDKHKHEDKHKHRIIPCASGLGRDGTYEYNV